MIKVVLQVMLRPSGWGLFDQPRQIVVLERQTVPVGQADRSRIPRFIQIDAVALAAEVAAGNDPFVLVVLHFQLTTEDVGRPARSGLEVITKMKVFAITGPVLDHAGLAINGFPTVVTAQAQCVAVTGHHAFGIAKPAHGIAIAIDHFDELAVVVVALLDLGFHSQVVDDAFDVGQAAQWIVIVQMHPHAAGGTNVGKRTVGRSGEMQIMPERVFQTLQGRRRVVVRDLPEIEKGVIEGLQEVVAAGRSDQMNLFVGVVDAFARLDVDKGHAAALIVGEVNKAAAAAQALFPRQRKP